MKKVILFLTLLLITQASAFEFCDEGIQGESNLRLISVDDMLKDNSKEWTWESLAEIEIEARVENNEDEDTTYILEATFRDSDGKIEIVDDSNNLKEEFSLSAGERKSVSLNFKVDEDANKGEYDLYLKLYKKDDEGIRCVENSEEKIEIEKIELCENDNTDIDELEITKIIDELKDNSEAWTWAPGNDIKISLDLENKAYSERTFTTELIMLDKDNNEIQFSENLDDLKKEKEINENDKEQFDFYFTLKSDIKEEEYTLYAKSHDKDNDNICTSLKAQDKSSPKIIKIKRSERRVIMKKIEGPTEAETLSEVQYTATIVNLGSEDEEKVLAIIYNFRLNLTEKIEITNLNSGEEETITFNFIIPENASLSRHAILFSTEFEYNENQDYYKSYSDEDDDIKKYLTISLGIEPEETEETNETTLDEVETIIKNETIKETIITTITGNVIGPSGKTSFWPFIGIAALILITTAIILRKRKPKQQIHTQPNVTRRYTARLD